MLLATTLLLPLAIAPSEGGDQLAAVQALFDESCTICHDSSAELNLEDAGALVSLKSEATGKALVVPGDANASYLYLKMVGAEGIEEGRVEIACQAIKEGDTRMISLRIVSPRAQVPVEQLDQARRGFFRLPGHSGLGLGLPIATAVVEQQSGKLLIQDGADYSQVGVGNMAFDLRLPALTARRAVRPRLR